MNNELKDLAYSYYNNAIDSLKKNDLSKANKLLGESRKIIDDKDILNLHGLVLFRLNYMKDSIATFERSLELYGEDNLLANSYLENLNGAEFSGYIKNYDEALVLIKKGKYDEAIKYLNACLKFNDEIVDIYLLKGICFNKLKKINLEIKEIEKALQYDSNNKLALRKMKIFKRKNKNDNEKAILVIAIIIILLSCSVIITFKLIKANKVLKNDNKNLVFSMENILNQPIEEAEVETVNLINTDELKVREMAIESFKNGELEFSNSLFYEIYTKSADINLVEEACFYLAVVNEELLNATESLEYYEKYIKTYYKGGYYGESIYNAALLSLKNGDIARSKEYAVRILNELSYSIYANDKIHSL